MKLKLAIALLAAFAAFEGTGGAPAFAADVFHPGGMKDDGPAPERAARSDHSGFYITGDLGVANGNRSVSRTNDRGVDLDITEPAYSAVLDANHDGTVSDDERAAASAALDTVNIPHTISADSINIPLIADRLGIGADADFSATVFGGELSYLYQVNRRIGFEVGVGVTFYGNSDSSFSYTDASGKYVGGTALADANFGGTNVCDVLATCAGDTSHFPQSGFVNVERNYDIDLIGRLHYFLNDRISVSAGGGISFARANISGGTVDDTGIVSGLDTAFSKDDYSIGYVVNAGLNYWILDYVRLSAEYSYKHHNFSADSSAADSVNLGTPGVDLNGHAHDRVNVEDDVHAIKARVGITLN